MLDLSTAKKLLVLERLVIGVEEPILIKGAGEFSAKIDSGNSGYNVIHGEDLYVNGDILVFATFNAEGEIRRISKKIQSYLDVNIGGGHIESRPVVLLDIKFADEDYKSVPFSVTNRSAQKNKVLICKDFISKELDALIDPGAENISSKGVEAELTEESTSIVEGVGKKIWGAVKGTAGMAYNLVKGAPGAVTRLGNAAANFKQGQGGAATGFISSELDQLKKATIDQYKGKFTEKHTKEYETFKRNEAAKKKIETQIDPKGARIVAQSENIAQLSGVPGANVNNCSIFGVLDYDGYISGKTEPVSSQKNYKDLVTKFLAAREAAAQNEKNNRKNNSLKKESYLPEANEQPQQAQEQNPVLTPEEQNLTPEEQAQIKQEMEEESKIFSPFQARNFFRFSLMSFFEEGDKEAHQKADTAFTEFMKKHESQMENYANQFFSALGSSDFQPSSSASITFINNIKMLMENDSDITGVFFVSYGDLESRNYSFFKRKSLILTPDAAKSKAKVRELIQTYNKLKAAWMNDKYLKNLPIQVPNMPGKNWLTLMKKDPVSALLKLRKGLKLPILYVAEDTIKSWFTDKTEKIIKNLVDFFSEFRVKDQNNLSDERKEIFALAKKNLTNYTPPEPSVAKIGELRNDYDIIKFKWSKDPILQKIDLDFFGDTSLNRYESFMNGLKQDGLDYLRKVLSSLNIYNDEEYFTEGQIAKSVNILQSFIDFWKNKLDKLKPDEINWIRQNNALEPYRPENQK